MARVARCCPVCYSSRYPHPHLSLRGLYHTLWLYGKYDAHKRLPVCKKLAYGPRIPMTPIAVPLVHNTMPLIGGKSYTEAVEWKYHRLPGFGHVQRNDVVVFNAPDGDTAIDGQAEYDYYQLCRMLG